MDPQPLNSSGGFIRPSALHTQPRERDVSVEEGAEESKTPATTEMRREAMRAMQSHYGKSVRMPPDWFTYHKYLSFLRASLNPISIEFEEKPL
jgi:hypothetical protein